MDSKSNTLKLWSASFPGRKEGVERAKPNPATKLLRAYLLTCEFDGLQGSMAVHQTPKQRFLVARSEGMCSSL